MISITLRSDPNRLRIAWYCRYAAPATPAAPNIAGILANLRTRFGNALAKEMDRTAGALWIEYAPEGHIRSRPCL